jgi:hypothetical protein
MSEAQHAHSQDRLQEEIARLAQRYPGLTSHTAARSTLRWFEQKVAVERAAIDEDWRDVRTRMRAANATRSVTRIVTIDNDFWICKRANPSPKPENALFSFSADYQPWSLQQWTPPEDWMEWPLFEDGSPQWLSDRRVVTAHGAELSADTESIAAATRGDAMKILADLQSAGLGTTAELLGTQAVAWVDTSLGRVGRYFVRDASEDIEPDVLLHDLHAHVLARHSSITADMMEDALQALYGSALGPRHTLEISSSPGGQSHEWQEYFRALGHVMPSQHTLMAVQLASRMLRSESVWITLTTLQSEGRRAAQGANLIDLSMCVRRRWALALKALAWLEAALVRAASLKFLSSADLACFAIDALLPLYPRPVVAVSHRGADAKATLAAGTAWGSNEVLLDATFRPHWQTNRAMVWSLFASTPVLCKIRSSNYSTSEWCQRESELFDYLTARADFLRGRSTVDIDLEEVRVLDTVAVSNPRTHRWYKTAAGLDSAPFELRRMEPWEGVLIRAAAVTRVVGRAFAVDAVHAHPADDIANRMLEILYGSDVETVPDAVFWVFVDGWRRLSSELRTDASVLGVQGPLARLVKADAADDATEWFKTIARHPPRTGHSSDLGPSDLCAALQWREHLEPYLRQHTAGTIWENQAAIIDVRETNPDEWATHPGWTVARGLVFLRLPYPILIRQRADQHAENWPLLRELDIPMFTEHLPDQRLPQSEVFFSLGGSWPGLFAEAIHSFVELGPQLADACRATLVHGPDPVMIRADGGLSALSI